MTKHETQNFSRHSFFCHEGEYDITQVFLEESKC